MAEHLGSSTVRREPDRDVIALAFKYEINGFILAAVRQAAALANKMARIAWKLMVTGDNYAKTSTPATLAGTA